MSDIRCYFRGRNCLPDPTGPPSRSLSSSTITFVNSEVEKAMNDSQRSRSFKRGPYTRYTAKERAQIGKYAHLHGITATAKHFSRKMGVTLSKPTVQSILKSYVVGVREKRALEDEDDEDRGTGLTVLPCKKRGRPLLLGPELDKKVQLYLRRVRDAGGVVTARIAVAAAKGVIKRFDKFKLAEYGGPIELNVAWAYALLERMGFVKRKATTAKSKYEVEKFKELKCAFLNDVKITVEMEDIPAELILNWDQTGIRIVSSSNWTMEVQGAKRVGIIGVGDKRQITAIFCGSLTGDFLPLQVIYSGKTSRCHPRFQFPQDWNITHSPNHWSNEQTMIEYISEVIVPYVENVRDLIKEVKPALVVMDNFKGQITDKVNALLEENDIHVCLLPANTTDRLQPMDISVNKPAKEENLMIGIQVKLVGNLRMT